MKKFISPVHNGARLILAALLGHQAVSGVFPGLPLAMAFHDDLQIFQMFTGLGAIYSALLFVVCIWLAFGVRSRIVALWGLALQYAVFLAAIGAHAPLEGHALYLIGVTLAAVPVVLFGGGSRALYRRGWSFGV